MIPKEFWERFKNKKIAVHCKTEDEAKDFVKQCYENRIEWFNSIYDSNYNVNTTDYKNYENGIYYRIFFDFQNKISFTDENMNYCRNNNYTIIPFSEINKSIKEENKMQIKPNEYPYRGNEYTYRGQVFTDVVEYAKYILKCVDEDRVKAEKERQDKLKAEKTKRTEELEKEKIICENICNEAYKNYISIRDNAREKYKKIYHEYFKDYNANHCNDNNIPFMYAIKSLNEILSSQWSNG